MTPKDSIALCIRRCARAQDGRGPWQAERSLQAAMRRLGHSERVAAVIAAGARSVGDWLRTK